MDEKATIKELQAKADKVDGLETRITELEAGRQEREQGYASVSQELARLREGNILQDAQAAAGELVNGISYLPDYTKARILKPSPTSPASHLLTNPPTKEAGEEGQTHKVLDRESLTSSLKAICESEAEHLAQVTGRGRVSGLGGGTGPGGEPADPKVAAEKIHERLVANFQRLGLSETAAGVAATGRV